MPPRVATRAVAMRELVTSNDTRTGRPTTARAGALVTRTVGGGPTTRSTALSAATLPSRPVASACTTARPGADGTQATFPRPAVSVNFAVSRPAGEVIVM